MTKEKKRLLAIFLSVAVIIAAISIAVYTHKLIIFKRGFFFSNASSIKVSIDEEEIDKLDYFTELKEADLRQSSCYKEIEAWGQKHPNVRISYTVYLPENITNDEETHTLDLTKLNEQETFKAGEDYLYYLKATRFAKLNLDGWSVESLAKFIDTYPNVSMQGTFHINDIDIPLNSEVVDAQGISGDSLVTLQELLPNIPSVKGVDFGKDEDHGRLKEISTFAKENENYNVDYTFKAFGKEINIHDDKLDFNHITMNDGGKEVREILACMPEVTFLDMDFCGVGDADMAKIRDDFPEIEVVWRIWFGTGYSVRTNVTKILASEPSYAGELTPANTQSLKYCTKIKYLDIGHNNYLRDISFVSYMPDLEVLIIMLGGITDISPLKDCPKLEFLEVFSDNVTDLSPLKNCKDLKHLNICNNPNLRDISPIYGCTKMERLWIGAVTPIPKYQIYEFKSKAPQCDINDWCGDPHTNWRWGTERYALLQKQLGYLDYDYQFYWNDPLYEKHD